MALRPRSYAGRRVLVVGGGDSAVEAAVALAEQAGTTVTLCYRRAAFFRIKPRNERRLDEAVREGRVQLALEAELRAVARASVTLEKRAGERFDVPNDDVFVMVGGVAPIDVLSGAGVSFDPADRPAPEAIGEAGTGLVRALGWALALTLATRFFAAWNLDYYALERADRPAHLAHDALRPGRRLGLLFGVGSLALVAVNLLYLVRRWPRFAARFAAYPSGSLRAWMTSHVATGVLALLLALLHSTMAPRNTVGSHAMWALLALLVTGAVGRYLYAWVPRAANGRELELDAVKGELAALSAEWNRQHADFGAEARARVNALVHERQWKTSFFGRVLAIVGGGRQLRAARAELSARGAELGLARYQIDGVLALTERAFRTATSAAHIEDVRALVGSWRYLHRWMAALMITLALLHIGQALFYGQMFGPDEPLRLTDRQPAPEAPR